MRNWTLLPLLALYGLLSVGTAHGQLIESAYPDDVPGFDTGQGVSVTSRIQSDVAWHEIPLGAELLHPEVTESISHDSAILADRQPSWIVETAPSVTLTSNDTGHSIAAVASADNSRYLAAPGQSDTDWTAAVGGTFDIADCSVTAAVAHLALHENDTALDAADYDEPLAYSVNTLRLSGQTPVSRLVIKPSFDLTQFQFGSATIGGVAAPQTYRDRLVAEAGITVFYGITGYDDPNRLQATLEPVAGHYPNQTAGEPSRDFTGGTVLLGVEHDLDGLWGWRLLAGAGGRIYRDDPYQDQLVPLVDAAITWQPNERTTWHAALFRQIESAADEGIGGYVATIGGVAVDRELQRDLILHLGADVDRADFVGSSETFITERLGVQWLISPVLRAAATATLTDHQSTAATPYGENLFMLSMTAGL